MGTLRYFAYGSNMLLQRLKRRCASVRLHCIASAPGYAIAFVKRGKDDSGKATLVMQSAGDARAHGVVFEIDETDIAALDAFEGRGYDRINDFEVETGPDSKILRVSTYIAIPNYIDSSLQPFDWYLNLVVAGAEQAGLTETYTQMLRACAAVPDPEADRPTRLEALQLLAEYDQGSKLEYSATAGSSSG